MQEEVENKTVNLAISTTKLSSKAIVKGLASYIRHRKNKKAQNSIIGDTIQGKQKVKELIGQGQGVSSMPIGETGLKDFEKIAKKYGVDFAIVKDKTVTPIKYTVFFKAKDADAIMQVLSEYAAKQVKKKTISKPSVLQKLKKFKDLVASIPKKAKEKRKEQER